MNRIKSVLLASAAVFALGAAAQAADLPTKKTPPAPAPAAAKNCLASFATWLDATATDCPLSAAGITVYGQIDIGASLESNGANPSTVGPNPLENVIGGQGHGEKFTWAANQLSPSNVGVKVTEPLFGDLSFIADWRLAFDPASMRVSNGPGSLIANNDIAPQLRGANGSSSYNGVFDNNRLFAGLSSPTLGTLKIGRIYTFANDLTAPYDATAGSYGFSGIGYSGTWFSGMGVTESNRYNLGGSYVYDYNKIVHVGGGLQFGDWTQGNDAKSAYNLDIGGSFAGLNVDAVYQHSTDAIKLGAYSSGTASTVDLSKDLKATLANQDGIALMANYKVGAATFYGAYMHTVLSNPSDTVFPNGFSNVLNTGYAVLPAAVSTTAFKVNEVLQTAELGVKYSINPQFDMMGTYAHVWQNDYDPKPATDCVPFTGSYAGVGTLKSDCAGTTDILGLLLDYRPVKRIDTYVGVTYSTGTGGMVSGYWSTDNTAVTGGVRLSF